MKATKLIEYLQEIVKEYGDCEVAIDTNYDFLWKYIVRVDHVKTSTYVEPAYSDTDEKIILR